jgi:hypothetical protein
LLVLVALRVRLAYNEHLGAFAEEVSYTGFVRVSPIATAHPSCCFLWLPVTVFPFLGTANRKADYLLSGGIAHLGIITQAACYL